MSARLKALRLSLLSSILFAGVVHAQQSLQFTVQFNDSEGYTDITRAFVTMGSARCQVEVYPSTGEFDLFDGPGGARSATAKPGANTTLANEECSISAAGSSIAVAGNQLRVTVQAAFSKALPIHRPFTAYAVRQSGQPELRPISAWIDPGPRSPGSAPFLATLPATSTNTCSYNFPDWDEGYYGGGAYSILLLWNAAPGCQGSAASSVGWITVGTPGSTASFDYIPISIAANTSPDYQQGTVTFNGANYSNPFQLSQMNGGSGYSNVNSLSPPFGSGQNQIFTIPISGGDLSLLYQQGFSADFTGSDGNSCSVGVTWTYDGQALTNATVTLVEDSGATSTGMILPSLESLRNTMCAVNGPSSLVALSGQVLTIQLAMSFSQAFIGDRYVVLSSARSAIYGIWTVPVDPTAPALRIAKIHTGNFTQLQSNATYTIIVSNVAGAAPTSGAVTVADTLPPGLTLVSMNGSGWNCAGSSCSRNDPLAAGNSYGAITVTVNVGSTFIGGANVATVSGGGALTLSASDYTGYTANPAVLSVSCSHSGNFTQGQTNATYSIVVSNSPGAEPTSSTVTVYETPPPGLTVQTISGTGWTCATDSDSCSRNDPLAAGTSYPPITVTVSVSIAATSPLVNSVTVYGGAGAVATDSTIIVPYAGAITIQANINGAPFSLEDGTVYLSPMTFYWASGAQHTVTWLTASPGLTGALYAFQSWSDGGSNPRTFTATATATYTATIAAQFLLIVNNANPGSGTVSVSPASTNGYYAAGTQVTISATPEPGMMAQLFSGDIQGYSPLTVTMNTPYTETANFACTTNVMGIPSNVLMGAGPVSGLVYSASNPLCSLTLTSSATWFALGTPTQYAGYNVVPYSISENTGATGRQASISVSGQTNFYLVEQDGEPEQFSESNIVSVSPASGTGSSQVFTVQAYNPAGYGQINSILYFANTYCSVSIAGNGGSPSVSLYNDSGGLDQLVLPGTGSVHNSACAIDAATSSVSASGNLATIQLGLSFTAADAGVHYIGDSANRTTLGFWTVPADPSAAGLSVEETYIFYGSGLNPGTSVAMWTTVTNAPGSGATVGIVTVADTLAPGLSLASPMTGTGWTCTGTSCTRNDALAGGSSYPPINFTVNIAANAMFTLYDVVTVSGGGSAAFTSPDPIYVNGPPTLSVQSTHVGNFFAGQTGATYSLLISDRYGSLATSSTVTVTENLPSGLALVSMSGTGWTCSGNKCTRGDSLAGGSGYPAILVTVNVSTTATSPQVNQVTASGGGSAMATANDSTLVIASQPQLSLSLTDNGPFTAGSSSPAYTIVVSNGAGSPATSGVITVNDILPSSGLSITSVSATGWTCNPQLTPYQTGYQCTRSDPLAGGASYPPIVLGANVSTTSFSIANQASLSGGGGNPITASDTTAVIPPAAVTATLTDSGNFIQGGNNATYTITISNKAGVAAWTGQTTVLQNLYLGFTVVSIAGTGWQCSLSYADGYCSRNDSLAAGSSFPPVTVTVNIASNTSSPLSNGVFVSPVGWIYDSTVVQPQSAGVTIQANVAGAPFSLDDGSVYLSPVTFYWPSGGQHKVTWLTAIPGQTNARYAFQSWADGGGNPRTFSSGVTGTYTATLAAQYQLSLSTSPANEGSVTANPSSPDGFYSAGQSVTLTATASTGYSFANFDSAITTNPYTVTMSAPLTVAVQFDCSYKFYGPTVNIYGETVNAASPGPLSTYLLWTTGPACSLSVTNPSSGFAFGKASLVNGFSAIPISLAENTGQQQTLTFTLSGPNFQWNRSINQSAAGTSTPGVVSLTPAQGNGAGGVFALQAYDAAGYTNIAEVDVSLTGTDDSECRAAMNLASGQPGLYLLNDSGTLAGPLNLPSSASLQNSRCVLNGAGSSVSGSGNYLTANFSLSFNSTFAGSKYITGTALDSDGNGGTNVLGMWLVAPQPAAPTLASPANAAGNVALSPSLLDRSRRDLLRRLLRDIRNAALSRYDNDRQLRSPGPQSGLHVLLASRREEQFGLRHVGDLVVHYRTGVLRAGYRHQLVHLRDFRQQCYRNRWSRKRLLLGIHKPRIVGYVSTLGRTELRRRLAGFHRRRERFALAARRHDHGRGSQSHDHAVGEYGMRRQRRQSAGNRGHSRGDQ
jgi:uncharacterized repeat protein (TIGR01451 family)